MTDTDIPDSDSDSATTGWGRPRPSTVLPPLRLMRLAWQAARAGHAVIPLHPGTQRPAVRNWQQWATRDVDVITAMWERAPYNIGLACTESGLVVVDLDAAHGASPPPEWAGATHGRDVLALLADAAGVPYPGETYTVDTPRYGEHLYFRAPAGVSLRSTVGTVGWHIDTRARGGFVVAAGSVRPQGMYRVRRAVPIAPLPAWLADKLTPPPAREPVDLRLPATQASAYVQAVVDSEADTVARAGYGTRHSALIRAASSLGRLVAAGELDTAAARSALYRAASVHIGVHDFTETEAQRTIADGLAYGARRPRYVTDPAP